MSIINLSNSVNSIKVKVKTTQTGLITLSDPLVLKQSITIGDYSKNIEDLKNVDSQNESDGDTLVFDKILQKWVAKQIDISEVTGIIDGGTF